MEHAKQPSLKARVFRRAVSFSFMNMDWPTGISMIKRVVQLESYYTMSVSL